VHARATQSGARTGTFETPHGPVATPAFMPVGTRGTVKGCLPEDLARLGATMVLANAYHLHLRPGEATVRALGGLHRFMAWDGPLLTDSGGYQVFSMSDLARVDDDGVRLRSIHDGGTVTLTPEGVVDIQAALGADVAMAFDHCPSHPTDRAQVSAATDRTHRWLERCVRRHRALGGEERGQALFGIVQGGAFEDLRRASVDAVCAHDLVGYAVGGVSVGEDRGAMRAALAASAPHLPEHKPRYLMGVGMPLDFFDAAEAGIDLFDCVTPTRHGRNHQAFTSRGRANLRNRVWAGDPRPLDPDCDCVCCASFSRGALRHLCTSDEMLGAMLLTQHNLRTFFRLFERIRRAIAEDRLRELRAELLPALEARLADGAA
jgi:queuine tRNA-ribosyltransferase